MREPWVSGDGALRERLSAPGQIAADTPDGAVTPYLASFLAHLRLLVGVPFEYLVSDGRMLPNESVRFFHLDRSWTDRLADGVLAVGKLGTREQAHHQAVADTIQGQIDGLEGGVRDAQRAKTSLTAHEPKEKSGGPITGMLLRSALVRGWAHMEVRAFADGVALTPLRIERLSSAVLIALWDDVADAIELEEPHHGVQFGITLDTAGTPNVQLRLPGGEKLGSETVPIAFRDDAHRVVDVTALRSLLGDRQLQQEPQLPAQTGSAAFAVELLNLPWKERFSDSANANVRAPSSAVGSVAALTLQLESDALAAELGGAT
jgi:hypothetical protein